jgi:hypothetical protein
MLLVVVAERETENTMKNHDNDSTAHNGEFKGE